MQKFVIFLFFVALLMPAMGSSAQDDSSDGYSPEIGTPQDNECFEGGDWAGECDTLWHWICGWYLARHTDGVFEYSQIPTWCNIPAPPMPEPQWTGNGGNGGGAFCPVLSVGDVCCATNGYIYQVTLLDTADADGDGCLTEMDNGRCGNGNPGEPACFIACSGEPLCEN